MLETDTSDYNRRETPSFIGSHRRLIFCVFNQKLTGNKRTAELLINNGAHMDSIGKNY